MNSYAECRMRIASDIVVLRRILKHGVNVNYNTRFVERLHSRQAEVLKRERLAEGHISVKG